MEKTESLEDFYETKLAWLPGNLNKELGHFNVFKLDDFVGCTPIPYSRKAYFKIVLIVGKNRVHYADKVVDIEKQCLFFASPMIPYRWEYLDDNQSGYFCIFTEAFFSQFGQIKEYPLFQPGGNAVFSIPDEKLPIITQLFDRMLTEIGSDYTYKYDIIRTLVFEMIHHALKLQPSTASVFSQSNAATRISSMFMELLERQFPIESPQQQLNFRSASEYADQLSVHVNHLNRALKEITGKTTSQIIGERVSQEAKVLLKQTNWNVNEISWCLGFEELPHFINFFRKNVGVSPRSFRTLETV